MQGDIRAIPATNDAADRVISSLVIHHVQPDEHAATFAELARVLRPGGTLFVIEIARPTTRWARLAFGWHSCVRAALPEARLRELARDAGFTCIATAATAPWVRWLRATKP
ncbi:class I SAM-dependent methyltransferase [Bowdeniella massiliensis]|uniref:class I SAM-dependent methyltransferase n=1 Tax=Bowdeniella massiliensis TaxID=2932264 RepID=UPI002027A457